MRAAGTALLALLTLVAVLPAREPTKNELLLAIEKQLKAANETVGPSVACVVASRGDRYPKPATPERPGKLGGYDPKEFLKTNPGEDRLATKLDLSKSENIPDHGYACGVVIDPTGLILTPYHVVEGATKVYVFLPGRTGSYADIHAADSRHDLAVLKLVTAPEKPLTPIKFAAVQVPGAPTPDPGARQPKAGPLDGKLVVLMANAYATGFNLDRPSSNLGSVTNVRWPPAAGNESATSYYTYGPRLEYDTKLIADAKPNVALKPVGDPKATPDISGAALLNLDGELIGLTTTSAAPAGGDRGPGFAFPADANFRRVVEVLRRGEEVEYGYMGVNLQRNTLWVEPTAHGPADRAGIRNGDTITRVNGIAITTYGELLLHVGSALAGERVTITVAPRRDVEVVLGKHPHGQPFIASARPEPVFGLRVDYGSVLAHFQREDAQVKRLGVPDGVSVREVAPDSPAAAAFKKLGDPPTRWLVTRVNGTAVGKPAEFYRLAKDQKSVKLTVIDPTEKDRPEREVTLP